MFRHDGVQNAPNKCTYSTWYYGYHFTPTCFDMTVYQMHQINALTVHDITILQLLLYSYMFRHDGVQNAPNKCTYSTWYYGYHFTPTCFDMTVYQMHQINALTVHDITVITLLLHVSTWQCHLQGESPKLSNPFYSNCFLGSVYDPWRWQCYVITPSCTLSALLRYIKRKYWFRMHRENNFKSGCADFFVTLFLFVCVCVLNISVGLIPWKTKLQLKPAL